MYNYKQKAGEYGDLVFSTQNTTGNNDSATERMRITSNGNVNVGSSTEQSRCTGCSLHTNRI